MATRSATPDRALAALLLGTGPEPEPILREYRVWEVVVFSEGLGQEFLAKALPFRLRQSITAHYALPRVQKAEGGL